MGANMTTGYWPGGPPQGSGGANTDPQQGSQQQAQTGYWPGGPPNQGATRPAPPPGPPQSGSGYATYKRRPAAPAAGYPGAPSYPGAGTQPGGGSQGGYGGYAPPGYRPPMRDPMPVGYNLNQPNPGYAMNALAMRPY